MHQGLMLTAEQSIIISVLSSAQTLAEHCTCSQPDSPPSRQPLWHITAPLPSLSCQADPGNGAIMWHRG